MRTTLSLLCLLALLSVATPAEAQFRQDLGQPAPTAVYEEGAQGSVGQFLSKMFDENHFQMTNTYEASFSSFGGESASLGLYTNTMQWRFNDAWAARVDLSLAHNLGGSALGLEDGRDVRLFLRNAEVTYQPSDNMRFRLQVRQSPYGRYAGPFGYAASPFGYAGFGNGFYDRSLPATRAPFQKASRR